MRGLGFSTFWQSVGPLGIHLTDLLLVCLSVVLLSPLCFFTQAWRAGVLEVPLPLVRPLFQRLGGATLDPSLFSSSPFVHLSLLVLGVGVLSLFPCLFVH